MFAPADYVLRPLTGDDEVVLWEMLSQALTPPEGEAPAREIMQRPEYARYVEGWGRPADRGYVVHDKEERTSLGAVFPDNREKYREKSEKSASVTFPLVTKARKPAHRMYFIATQLL